MSILSQESYVAVRKGEDNVDWIDNSTISLVLEDSQRKAEEIDKYCKLFPVQRFIKVKIEEIKYE